MKGQPALWCFFRMNERFVFLGCVCMHIPHNWWRNFGSLKMMLVLIAEAAGCCSYRGTAAINTELGILKQNHVKVVWLPDALTGLQKVQCWWRNTGLVFLSQLLILLQFGYPFLQAFSTTSLCIQYLFRLRLAWFTWLRICICCRRWTVLMPFLVLPWFRLFKPHANAELLLK